VAAVVNDPSSTTATKYSSWRTESVMQKFYRRRSAPGPVVLTLGSCTASSRPIPSEYVERGNLAIASWSNTYGITEDETPTPASVINNSPIL
jgi:hypothetical protein